MDNRNVGMEGLTSDICIQALNTPMCPNKTKQKKRSIVANKPVKRHFISLFHVSFLFTTG